MSAPTPDPRPVPAWVVDTMAGLVPVHCSRCGDVATYCTPPLPPVPVLGLCCQVRQ